MFVYYADPKPIIRIFYAICTSQMWLNKTRLRMNSKMCLYVELFILHTSFFSKKKSISSPLPDVLLNVNSFSIVLFLWFKMYKVEGGGIFCGLRGGATILHWSRQPFFGTICMYTYSMFRQQYSLNGGVPFCAKILN